MKGNVVFTDNSLGRYEEANRKLRQQCLDTLKSFIASCTDLVPPAQIPWFDINNRLLEKWFSSYRNKATNERMKKIMEYLAKDCEKEQLKTNKCLLCSEDVLQNDIAQTRCNHIFHYNCISLAIRKRGGPCPVCCIPVFNVYSSFG
ncbi:uncharacterized protein LOC136084168 [Hydra vulgaris]|uniref:Uncharacterized protein LOC136084168 n=1 Tax=Hydra vulgaris TaxID=6087 RepID=A0ABM4CFA4_HYDVU